MKQFLLAVFLCLFSTVFYAQKDKTIYLDSIGKETEYDNHMTYLVIKDFHKEIKQYNIYEYYKSGKLKSEGVCNNKWSRIKEGIYNRYYENGNLQSRTMYDNGLPYGDFTFWHENGNKSTEGEYLIFEDGEGKKTSKLFVKNYWDENNTQKVFNGNGAYTEIADLETGKGEVLNGFKNGLWEGYSKIGRLSFKEHYKKGELTEGTSTDSLNNTYTYKNVEVQAMPKKSMQDFYRKFISNFNAPEVKSHVKEIRVLLGFVIEKDGSISEIKTIRSDNADFDQTAKKVLSKMENWIPAVHRGKTLRSQFSLPITIKIN
ncbi:MAG TPA: energy transducer TonB [Flavobacterium sp.]|uniref:energy transducer TonB n=1 Tax=Flavobacterium sp. TaxID=239 RepID=UPI002C2A7506|nr:energy transducer TonB [Flavobacterium sp.]HSD13082.1 energy transducer TonB [Flavobacterium sp.]